MCDPGCQTLPVTRDISYMYIQALLVDCKEYLDSRIICTISDEIFASVSMDVYHATSAGHLRVRTSVWRPRPIQYLPLVPRYPSYFATSITGRTIVTQRGIVARKQQWAAWLFSMATVRCVASVICQCLEKCPTACSTLTSLTRLMKSCGISCRQLCVVIVTVVSTVLGRPEW